MLRGFARLFEPLYQQGVGQPRPQNTITDHVGEESAREELGNGFVLRRLRHPVSQRVQALLRPGRNARLFFLEKAGHGRQQTIFRRLDTVFNQLAAAIIQRKANAAADNLARDFLLNQQPALVRRDIRGTTQRAVGDKRGQDC